MKDETKKLLEAALNARYKMKIGGITYDAATKIVKNYIDHYNEKAKKISKEYGVAHKPLSVIGFLR